LDYSEGLPILFGDTKPSRSIGRVGRFENTCVYLLLDESADVFVDTWGNRNVAQHPRGVRDDWDVNRGKEVFTKVTSFRVCPSKAVIV
jgi:hypothetical protein